MKNDPQFDKEFKKLNLQQQLAVETIEGPVLVLAGPGTGKTQVLAMRVAQILRSTDAPPSAVLALTFTESAAKNMRQRLIQLIGTAAYQVRVQTFHGFCDEVLRNHPQYFPINVEQEVISDLDRYHLFEEMLDAASFTGLKTLNSPHHYLKSAMKRISDLKREGVSPEQYIELVELNEQELKDGSSSDKKMTKAKVAQREKDLVKMREMGELYEEYTRRLRRRGQYDYDDMISLVNTAFKTSPELLAEYQEQLLYFLVDEYQDTNSAQNAIIQSLASFWGDAANVFVVGDPHQSIYRFQGASLENTLNFVDHYPAAEVIRLEVGYRCPPTLYQAAAEVIQHNQVANDLATESEQRVLNELQKPLQSIQKKDHLIQMAVLPSPSLEALFIAEQIQELIKNGVSAPNIAVLYKQHNDAAELVAALNQKQLPYMLDSSNDVLGDELIRQLLTLLTVIRDLRIGSEQYSLFELLNYPWLKCDRFIVLMLARAAGKGKRSLYEQLQQNDLVGLTPMDLASVQQIIQKCLEWGQRDAELSFPDWLSVVMNESGLMEWVLSQPNRSLLVQRLMAICREAKALAQKAPHFKLIEFLTAIDTMRAHGLTIAVEPLAFVQDAVTLSTVHKAKGQEWQYVFLLGCSDGKWGNTRKRAELPLPSGILTHQNVELHDRNQDDRRLFYVALTRAKKQFVVSYAETQASGNKTSQSLGSMFLTEIESTHIQNIKVESFLETADERLATLFSPVNPIVYSDQERQWFTELVKDFKLSPTALNQYLRNPEEFVEDALLKVPQIKPAHLAFGTAIHSALEFAFRRYQKDQVWPSIETSVQMYETALRKELLTAEEFERRLKHGQKVLQNYLGQAMETPTELLAIEQFFGYGGTQTMLGDIPLVGRVDRVDWVDKTARAARVVDYKTGRARTINEVNGLTASADLTPREQALPDSIRGALKRQLLFYKLLTQLDPKFPAEVTSGVFEFVEPTADNQLIRREFTLANEDVDALKELIVTVMQEIRSLAFLDSYQPSQRYRQDLTIK